MSSISSTTKEKPTPTIENYLSKILEMERAHEEVVGLRLAEAMNVAAPTVSATLRRMERDGWIKADARWGYRLTATGREAASSILRRHMLAEWMLNELLDMPWSDVHAEAHQIEHTISDQVETQLKKNLNDPKFCPHGNPLPGNETEASIWIPMTEITPGTKIVIRRIHESAEDNKELLVFLEKNGILPGQEAQVVEIIPINQTIRLTLDDREVMLGYSIARFIHVEIIQNPRTMEPSS
jgi:DtxR family Mn-dependent transcriptional regulator